LGGRQGKLVEIISGPPMGAMVVTSGSSFLAEGEKVSPQRVVPAASPGAAPAPPPSTPAVPKKN
jgi:hypothetical protein